MVKFYLKKMIEQQTKKNAEIKNLNPNPNIVCKFFAKCINCNFESLLLMLNIGQEYDIDIYNFRTFYSQLFIGNYK